MGVLELDETVQSRAQKLKSTRETLLIELVGVRREYLLPVNQLKASQVEKFSNILKSKSLAKDSAIAKNYLNLLVDQIVVNDKTATMTGSYSALVHAAATEGVENSNLKQVPTFIPNWRPHRDSKGDADKHTPLALARVAAIKRRESTVNQYHLSVPLFLIKLMVNYTNIQRMQPIFKIGTIKLIRSVSYKVNKTKLGVRRVKLPSV